MNQETTTLTDIPIDLIDPNPQQPRQAFDEAKLAELAQSIAAHGVLQPVLVTPTDGRFTLIAGERRWRACQQANLAHIPAVVRDIPPEQYRAVAIIENIQRDDMTILEEALAYHALMTEQGYTKTRIHREVGVSLPKIDNCLRFLTLEPTVQQLMVDGRLPRSKGAVDAFLQLKEGELQAKLAQQLAGGKRNGRRGNVTIKAIQTAVTALQEMLTQAPATLPEEHRQRPTEPPCLAYGLPDGATVVDDSILQAVIQIGEKVCSHCAWIHNTCADICQECPASSFIRVACEQL